MIFVSTSLGCRDCLQGDGIKNIYPLTGANAQQFKDKTEFEVMTMVEDWNVKENKTCNFCGSSNLEVLDIEIDKYLLYDFERVSRRRTGQGLSILMINIDKIGNEISVRPGGSPKILMEFFEGAIDKITNLIDDRPDRDFVAHTRGNFLSTP